MHLDGIPHGLFSILSLILRKVYYSYRYASDTRIFFSWSDVHPMNVWLATNLISNLNHYGFCRLARQPVPSGKCAFRMIGKSPLPCDKPDMYAGMILSDNSIEYFRSLHSRSLQSMARHQVKKPYLFEDETFFGQYVRLRSVQRRRHWNVWQTLPISSEHINKPIGMFRKLVFLIWILFGIWVLGFGILVLYPEKEITSFWINWSWLRRYPGLFYLYRAGLWQTQIEVLLQQVNLKNCSDTRF